MCCGLCYIEGQLYVLWVVLRDSYMCCELCYIEGQLYVL